ncbi:hypothetical protein [Mycolicibacterium thermoresistibile]
MTDTDNVRTRGGRMHMRRSRGAVSGLLLLLLGLWGALIPFVGPYFNFAFTPDEPWAWTTGRGWLQVLPGVVVAVGGLILMMTRNRATAMLGGWLAVLGGAWFVVGRAFAGPLGLGSAGTPVATSETGRLWLEMTYFYGLGAVIIFLGAMALGRVSVRSVRDIEYATAPAAAPMTTTTAAPATTGTPAATTPAATTPAATTGAAATTATPETTPGAAATTATPVTGTDPVDRPADRPADRAGGTVTSAAPKRRRFTNPFGRRHTTAH